jgi:hypothetical protein
MESTAKEKTMAEVAFEIEGQAAAEIVNVGGDHNVYMNEARRRAVAIGRAIALTGLLVSLTGLAFLVVAGLETGRALPPDDWADYTSYVAIRTLVIASVLIVAGIVVGKVGRVFARR